MVIVYSLPSYALHSKSSFGIYPCPTDGYYPCIFHIVPVVPEQSWKGVDKRGKANKTRALITLDKIWPPRPLHLESYPHVLYVTQWIFIHLMVYLVDCSSFLDMY